MAEFPYCTNATSVRRFMEQIQNGAVPKRVGPKYMEGLGFRGSDGRSLGNILKALGFLTASGVPTARWRAYRDKTNGPRVLAAALHEAYSELFEAYPDAYTKEDEVLASFFGSETKVAQSTLKYMVRTFRTLCALADFHTASDDVATLPPASLPKPTVKTGAAPLLHDDGDEPPAREVAFNVTVQIQLPATDDPRVYEALFAALRKHLLK